MRITAGHDCAEPGCIGLAVFGFKFNGEIRWACVKHIADIGFLDRQRSGAEAIAPAGLQVGHASHSPAAAHPPKQARLL